MPEGVLAVWGESIDKGFEARLATAGFSVMTDRPGKGGLRHVIYIAKKPLKTGNVFLKEAHTLYDSR